MPINNIPDALENLKKAAAKMPQDPLVQYHLGTAYFQNRQLPEAKRALKLATQSPTGFKGIENAKKMLKSIDAN